jgi:hypothetical protein
VERLKAQKEAEIAILRAEEARRLADEEEGRLSAVTQDTVARRLREAEAVHAIATGGLIAAIRQIDADPVLLERLETPGEMGAWTHHDADRNREMSGALAPVLSDGLEALRQPPAGPGLLEGFSGFLRGLAGWVNRLAEASRAG